MVNPPVWRGSTHLYADSADLAKGRPNEDGHFYYGRRGSPTQWALAEALTELEPGAAGTVLYPSGASRPLAMTRLGSYSLSLISTVSPLSSSESSTPAIAATPLG